MHRLALAALAAVLLPAAAAAQTFTWDGGLSHGNITVNDNWSTVNNWVNGAPVSGANTSIVFTRSGRQTTATQNISNPFVLHSLTFDGISNVTALSGGILDFRSGLSAPASITQLSATNVTINNVVFVDPSLSLLVGGTGSGVLTLAGAIGGVGGNLVKTGTGTVVLRGNNSYTGVTQLDSGILRVDSAGALGGGGPILFRGGTLQYSAANQIDYSSRFASTSFTGLQFRIDTNGRDVTFASPIAGAGNTLTKLGTGTLTLTGTAPNTYSGLTSVLGGTLQLDKPDAGGLAVAALGGNLSIGNGTNPGAAGSAVVRMLRDAQLPINTPSNVTIFSDGLLDLNDHTANIGTLTMTGGEVRFDGGFLNLGGDVTVNASATGSKLGAGFNAIDFSTATRTFTIARGSATYDLDVQGDVIRGTLVKQGAGVLRLAGTNSNLAVTLNAGTLAVARDGALGSNNGTFTLSGGTVAPDSGNRTINNPVSLTGSATIGASLDGAPRLLSFTGATTLGANATLTVNNNATTGFGAVALGANTLTLAGPGATTIGGVISGQGALVKAGGGTLTLSGANTFSGGLTVSGGALVAKNDGALGGAGNVVTLLNGSPLAFTDAAVTTGRTFNLGTSTLTPAAGGSITYSGATVNGSVLGAGNHVLAGGTRFDGVRIGSGAAVSHTDGVATFHNVLFAGNSTFTQGSGSTLNTTGEFTANPLTTITVNGVINSAGATITGAVTINNGGTLATAGSPLFLDGSRGATVRAGGTLAAASGSTIELGGLLVNNGTHTGVLNINFGGFAKGSGLFGMVNINDGGRFSPGNSPGAVTTGDDTTWGAGGTYQWEVNDAAGVPGGPNGSDLWHVAGTLAITAGTAADSRFTIEITGLDGGNAPGLPANFDPSQSYQWTIATTADGVAGFDPAKFTLDTSRFAAPGTFALHEAGGVVVLSFTPVPEPGYAAAALVVATAAFRWPRRQRNRPPAKAAWVPSGPGSAAEQWGDAAQAAPVRSTPTPYPAAAAASAVRPRGASAAGVPGSRAQAVLPW